MSICSPCRNCQKQYRLRDEAAGRAFPCANCGQKISVPSQTAARPQNRNQSRTDSASIACPACNKADLHERELKNGLVVDVCPSCRGTWLDGGELFRLTESKGAAQQSIAVLSWDSTETNRTCPRCHSQMREGTVLDSNTQIDYCDDCDGLWFDATELKGTLQFLETCPYDGDVPGQKQQSDRFQQTASHLSNTTALSRPIWRAGGVSPLMQREFPARNQGPHGPRSPT